MAMMFDNYLSHASGEIKEMVANIVASGDKHGMNTQNIERLLD